MAVYLVPPITRFRRLLRRFCTRLLPQGSPFGSTFGGYNSTFPRSRFTGLVAALFGPFSSAAPNGLAPLERKLESGKVEKCEGRKVGRSEGWKVELWPRDLALKCRQCGESRPPFHPLILHNFTAGLK